MLGFIKKCFCTGLVFLLTLTSVNLLSCIVSVNAMNHVMLMSIWTMKIVNEEKIWLIN